MRGIWARRGRSYGPSAGGPSGDALLEEDDVSYILLEDGSYLLLE